jgi:hypothetical protein
MTRQISITPALETSEGETGYWQQTDDGPVWHKAERAPRPRNLRVPNRAAGERVERTTAEGEPRQGRRIAVGELTVELDTATQYATAWRGATPAGTFQRRRYLEAGPAWRVFDLDGKPVIETDVPLCGLRALALRLASPLSAQRLRGQVARLEGGDRNYGCHFGMRSTLERDRDEFNRGWDEIDAALGGRS